MLTKHALILVKEFIMSRDEMDKELDELLYDQGRQDYYEGDDPHVQDLAYLQGYASAENDDRTPPIVQPNEHLPV